MKYTIFVLWLHGLTISKICRLAMLFSRTHVTDDQVWGAIRNSPFGERAAMTDKERQGFLDILKSERLDGGRIKDWCFKIRPLEGRQR